MEGMALKKNCKSCPWSLATREFKVSPWWFLVHSFGFLIHEKSCHTRPSRLDLCPGNAYTRCDEEVTFIKKGTKKFIYYKIWTSILYWIDWVYSKGIVLFNVIKRIQYILWYFIPQQSIPPFNFFYNIECPHVKKQI